MGGKKKKSWKSKCKKKGTLGRIMESDLPDFNSSEQKEIYMDEVSPALSEIGVNVQKTFTEAGTNSMLLELPKCAIPEDPSCSEISNLKTNEITQGCTRNGKRKLGCNCCKTITAELPMAISKKDLDGKAEIEARTTITDNHLNDVTTDEQKEPEGTSFVKQHDIQDTCSPAESVLPTIVRRKILKALSKSHSAKQVTPNKLPQVEIEIKLKPPAELVEIPVHKFQTPACSLKSTLLSQKPQFNPVAIGTDLGVPSARNFRYEKHWNPLIFSNKLSTNFSSFAVARDLEQHVGVTDFVSDAETMKRLIKLSFSKGSVSLLMHRVGNTILVDNFDLSNLFLRGNTEQHQWEWLSNYAKNIVYNQRNIIIKEDKYYKDILSSNILHRLFYYSLNDDLKFKTKNVKEGKNCLEQPPESTLLGSRTQFLQKLFWEWGGFSFLLGSNVPAFEMANGSTVTIRENNADISKAVPALDYIDSWLDNLMLNASETFFCHHEESIVVKTEYIKTENLQGPDSFDENLVIERSQKLLFLLKESISKSGHSYWFYKAPGEDVFEISDLTRISQRSPGLPCLKLTNPIMPSIGTLLYRICDSSYCVLPPTTVLAMMRHFVSIYPEDKYPLLALSAIFIVLNSRINSKMDVFHPELELINGYKQSEIDLSYNWNNYCDPNCVSDDIFTVTYFQDSISQSDLKIFNELQVALDEKLWSKLMEADKSNPKKDYSKLRIGSNNWHHFTSNGCHAPVEKKRNILLCEFFPENVNTPHIIKSIHEGISKRQNKNTGKKSGNILTFSCHNVAFTTPIQKPLPPGLNEGILNDTANENNLPITDKVESLNREAFFNNLRSKCVYLLRQSTVDFVTPKPTEWIFYLTCKHLFKLFTSAFCIIDDVFGLREKNYTRKKGKQASVKDDQLKQDLNKIFREKLALLFLCISYFAYTRTPSHTLLGRFCAKWALFLNGEGFQTKKEVASSAWKIAGDLLALTLGADNFDTDIGKKLCTYEDFVMTNYPDVGFLCKMSQGNRNILMVNTLKDYDSNFYQKSTLESAVWLAYSRAVFLAPDKYKDLVNREIANAVGLAALDCFHLCQVQLSPNSVGDTSLKNPVLRGNVISRLDEIIDYFDMAVTSYPHTNSLVHYVRMKVFRAEIKYWKELKGIQDVGPSSRVTAIEQFQDVLEEIYKKTTADDGNTLIPNTVYDEISWRLSSNELEHANTVYMNMSNRKSCKVKFSADTTYYEDILMYLVMAEQNANLGRCYPSLGRQKLQLAKIYERRGIVNYTMARIHGYQDTYQDNQSRNLHGKNICFTGNYHARSYGNKTSEELFDMAKIYLKGAQDAFNDEAMVYIELGCPTELIQAYLCYMNCRLGLVDEARRAPLELSLLCGILPYLPMYEVIKNRNPIKEIINSAYNIETIIGTSLLCGFGSDNLEIGITCQLQPLDMLTRVSKRLNKCLSTLMSRNDDFNGRLNFAKESIEENNEFTGKDKSECVKMEDHLIHLSYNIQKIRKVILHENSQLSTLFSLNNDKCSTRISTYNASAQETVGRGGGDGHHIRPLDLGLGLLKEDQA